jgi:deoxyribodipyrimidine photolyase-related protein
MRAARFRVGVRAPVPEWRLDAQLVDWAQRQAIPCRMVDTEHFLTTRDEAAQLFAGRRQWLMEHFYRRMRTQHRVLLDDAGNPVGGQWNFDHDNRKPWPGLPREPADPRTRHDIRRSGDDRRGRRASFGAPRHDSHGRSIARSLAELDAFVESPPALRRLQDALTHRRGGCSTRCCRSRST